MDIVTLLSDGTTQIVSYAIILCLGAIAGIFSERSGTVNIGIEAMMSMGGLGYALTALTFNWILGDGVTSGFIQIVLYVVSILGGMLFGALLGFATFKLKAEHTISGVALNVLALGIAATIVSIQVLGGGNKVIKYPIDYNALYIPVDLYGFERILSFTSLLFIGVVIAAWILLNKTSWGLRFKAVGENPQAVDVAGVNVLKIKWQGIMLSGALAGLAGGVFVNFSGPFDGNVNGLGFLAIAVMIMAHWNIGISVIVAFVFGFFQYTGIIFSNGTTITDPRLTPYGELFKIIPYILTLVALVVFSKLSPGPAAAGKVYDKSLR